MIILITLATPFGNYVKDSVTATIESFSDKTKLTFENAGLGFPERMYTMDEINADDHLYAVGATAPESVIAKFNSDYSKMTISKNGENSDGVMDDSIYRFFLSKEKYLATTKRLFEEEYNTEVDLIYDDSITDVIELDENIEYFSHETGDELTLTDEMRAKLNPTDLLEHSPKTIIVKKGVTNISDFAFIMCGDIEEVILPSTIETIGDYAFQYCKNLKKIVIPEGVELTTKSLESPLF